MPPRARVTVEEFDDDTDLPLPPHGALPNTGARGALLEQIGVDDARISDDDSDDDAPPLVPASASAPAPSAPGNMGMRAAGSGAGVRPSVVNVTDTTPYKKWTTVYPLYIDAKAPYGPTQRRLARSKAVWWPLSQDLADAARKLGLQVLHEPTKFHPRDWANPGRVKVLLKKDGRAVHPTIRTKRQLVERLAGAVQLARPDWVPAQVNLKEKEERAGGPSTSTSKDGKNGKGRPPKAQPPKPWPPLAERVSPYSPALEAGMLVEAVKASLAAPQPADGAPVPGGGGKGKKKVIRVRG